MAKQAKHIKSQKMDLEVSSFKKTATISGGGGGGVTRVNPNMYCVVKQIVEIFIAAHHPKAVQNASAVNIHVAPCSAHRHTPECHPQQNA